jgi:hypothetical protein
MNVSLKSISIIIIGLLLITGCGEKAVEPSAEASFEKSPELIDNNRIKKGADDIALSCNYSDNSNQTPLIFIYSEKYSVGKFGKLKNDGEWDPEYRIISKSSTNYEITFDVSNYNNLIVQRLNPNAEISPEKIRVNRSTLDMEYETDTKYVGFIRLSYTCDLLGESQFEKHVQWVIDNTNRQKQENKI